MALCGDLVACSGLQRFSSKLLHPLPRRAARRPSISCPRLPPAAAPRCARMQSSCGEDAQSPAPAHRGQGQLHRSSFSACPEPRPEAAAAFSDVFCGHRLSVRVAHHRARAGGRPVCVEAASSTAARARAGVGVCTPGRILRGLLLSPPGLPPASKRVLGCSVHTACEGPRSIATLQGASPAGTQAGGSAAGGEEVSMHARAATEGPSASTRICEHKKAGGAAGGGAGLSALVPMGLAGFGLGWVAQSVWEDARCEFTPETVMRVRCTQTRGDSGENATEDTAKAEFEAWTSFTSGQKGFLSSRLYAQPDTRRVAEGDSGKNGGGAMKFLILERWATAADQKAAAEAAARVKAELSQGGGAAGKGPRESEKHEAPKETAQQAATEEIQECMWSALAGQVYFFDSRQTAPLWRAVAPQSGEPPQKAA
ncbi:hypothetical protein BESB_043870 [Besnoitia besnoiti]|uniref:Uncharacterized protein n=1 Tax=Besnoitia besnoiti TaxID=94643 RepID=A0A2A9MDX3_BESBE|nr:hypothetical protein BESB_043870 [Besnoitia besnoiti]PFH36195.1 hypothetical protein BESB_043870 [Besnoitia besnoiti]